MISDDTIDFTTVELLNAINAMHPAVAITSIVVFGLVMSTYIIASAKYNRSTVLQCGRLIFQLSPPNPVS